MKKTPPFLRSYFCLKYFFFNKFGIRFLLLINLNFVFFKPDHPTSQHDLNDKADINDPKKSIRRRQLVSRSSQKRSKPIEPCKLYAAKSLVLISRLEYVDLFKSCLSLIYAVYVDKRIVLNSNAKLLETIVANLLTIQVNAPGTALSNSFTLGADDKHLIQASASLTVPCTGSSVFKLFKEIGIVNVFKLVCAIMADFKVLFFSRSYTKLYEACRALEALLFPLKYTGVYVPVLPCFGSFLEFPAAPTPYIIGVHANYRRLIEEMHSDCLQECVKVDLDGASVCIPQSIEDLICGLNSDGSNLNSNCDANNSSSTSSSGISMTSSSFSSSSNLLNTQNICNSLDYPSGVTSSYGLPHYLYESTLNLLFAILKPDVLKADELAEFSNQTKYSTNSSFMTTTNSKNDHHQQQHHNHHHHHANLQQTSYDQHQYLLNDSKMYNANLTSSTNGLTANTPTDVLASSSSTYFNLPNNNNNNSSHSLSSTGNKETNGYVYYFN